jgi:hypothetical protein
VAAWRPVVDNVCALKCDPPPSPAVVPNAANSHFLGLVLDANGSPIAIDGPWGIEFDNRGSNRPLPPTLLFAASINDYADGLFGR